jgi:galactokinase/galacturonokinase
MNFPKHNEEIKQLTAYLDKREKSTVSEQCVVVSPYSISPLGADIEAEGGPTLSMAVNAYTLLVFFPNNERTIRLYSINSPGVAEFGLEQIKTAEKNDWGRYAMGAAKVFKERYNADRGFSGALYCTLPGSGLGTSSSECLAYLKAIAHVNNIEPLGWEYAELVRRIENDYLKGSSGTLSSLSVLQGKKDCMIYSDTGSVNITAHPGLKCGQDYNILIAYSGQAVQSAPPDLERRLEETRKATGILTIMAGLRSARKLSQIPAGVFNLNAQRLPEELRPRAEHYFTEAERVEQGILAWNLGRLMNESCRSRLDKFGSVSPGIQTLYEILRASPRVFGSSFSGGGYGGSVIAFVKADFSKESAADILQKYLKAHPEAQGRAAVYFAQPEGGMRLFDDISQA